MHQKGACTKKVHESICLQKGTKQYCAATKLDFTSCAGLYINTKSLIELCGTRALFGIFFETTKQQNPTRPRPLYEI